mgnify:FL=1
MKRFLWPLVVFAGLVALLGAGLMKNPREVPSPLVGRAAPAFVLPTLADPAQQLGPQQLRGRVWVLNV